MVQDVVIAGAQVNERRPGIPPILGDKQLPRTGAQQDVVGIGRVVGQTAHVATFGADQAPIGRIRAKGEQHGDAEEELHDGQNSFTHDRSS